MLTIFLLMFLLLITWLSEKNEFLEEYDTYIHGEFKNCRSSIFIKYFLKLYSYYLTTKKKNVYAKILKNETKVDS